MDDRKEGADVCTAANLFAIKLLRIYNMLPRETYNAPPPLPFLGARSELFMDSKIASRELFVAFNEDTHPASLFK